MGWCLDVEGLVVSYQPFYLGYRIVFEGYLMCQQLPQNHPETVDIGRKPNFILLSPQHLRSHPLVCSDPLTINLLLLFVIVYDGKSEITQLNFPVISDEYV